MAKFASDEIMDIYLTAFGTACQRVGIALSQPANYGALGTSVLGTVVTVAGNFTNGNGDVTGRKVTHGAATITVGTSGTISHIVLYGTVGSGTLHFVGTCAPTAVTAAGTIILNAWDFTEIGDPT
jgi:hypothetical protein